MRRRLTGQRGMSLVEATIILMVLSLLTAMFAPSLGDYVNDAKDVKVKEDLEEIGLAIERTVRDTGQPFLEIVAATGTTKANRVDVLTTDGNAATLAAGTTATLIPASTATTVGLTWNEATNTSTCTIQFITNATVAYPQAALVTSFGVGGPRLGIGWRGAYLDQCGPDPWGTKYYANTIFLGVASDSAAGSGEGAKSGGWSFDTIVLSAGRNTVIDTKIDAADANHGTTLVGDDVAYVVQGATR